MIAGLVYECQSCLLSGFVLGRGKVFLVRECLGHRGNITKLIVLLE